MQKMANSTARNLGFAFGLVGGGLLIAAAIVAAVSAGIDYASAHAATAAITASTTASVVLFVLGGLVLFFAYLGQKAWRDRPIASGIVLVVLAAVGLGVLGLGAGGIALVGAILVLIAGVLFLVEPATTMARSTATTS